LRTNNLSSIPDEIGRIPNLHVLNLSDNKLCSLPFGLMKLKHLTALWLADNQVCHFELPCGTVLQSSSKKKVKEVDLYSTFIEVPYTQGAQVQITQCYLQITLYLPLPRKHSPDGTSPD